MLHLEELIYLFFLKVDEFYIHLKRKFIVFISITFFSRYAGWTFFFFFFLINNVKILLIKKKIAEPHWGCTMGAQIRKQKNNDQEKWEKTTLHSKRVCKKKDLISSKKRSQPSKLLAFLSRQMHQIKQWGTNLQTSIWQCCANFPCQASNNSRIVWGITHWIPNKQKTKDHNS